MENLAGQADLFEPGEYIDQARPGYFTLGAKPEGRWRQESYPVEHLATVVHGVNPFHDSYITQAVFERANRCVVDVRDTALLFVDLDTYRTAALAGKTPEEQTALLLLFCGQEGIPAPSIVMFSGRGLQAKWLLTSAIPRVELHVWNQAQLALVRLLELFAPDRAAIDVSRVLRLDRTVNTKSGERCRVVHVTGGVEGCPARYDIDELRLQLCGEVQATAPKESRRKVADRTILTLPASLGLQRLNWRRLEDLRTLVLLRKGGAADLREGQRELMLFWQLDFLLLAQIGKPVDVWNAAESLARKISSEDFYQGGEHGTLSTLYRKAKAALEGEAVELGGRALPPLYTPRNAYLIDRFRITPDEERQLRTIVSQEEKYRRLVEKRRAAGVLARDLYRQAALANTRPWEAEGVSRPTWYRRRNTP